MVEIESGKLLPHSPDFRSIVQLPVKYDSGASSPELDSFVESIVPQDCIDLIWEFLGYCLMPWRELKRILYLVGPPDAGKSTLLTVVFRGLFGEELVAYQTMHDLANKRFAAAELFGKLVNVAADLDDTPITSVGILKQVTGGDPISAERKYGQPFSFVSVARLIFAANSLPHYRSELGVVAERIIPVPCENVFVSGVDLDRDIAMNLSCGSVRSALLNRALQGAQRLMQRGCFHEPESVKAMRPTHLNTSDTLALFIRDYVDRHDKEASISKRDFYDAYCLFCQGKGLHPNTETAVGRRLRKPPYQFAEGRPVNPGSGKQEYSWLGVDLNINGRHQYLPQARLKSTDS